MNVGNVLEAHLAWAGMKSNKTYAIPPFAKVERTAIAKELEDAGLSVTGKVKLIDGRNGERFEQDVTVGAIYIYKLHHMAEEKIHARATGPYSLITQQPLGGKAQQGGQRFGEMEVWALEAYGASRLLSEMLTIKSDDIKGRYVTFQSIIKGLKIPESHISESFKLLVRQLNGLCLAINPIVYEGREALQDQDYSEVMDQGGLASAPVEVLITEGELETPAEDNSGNDSESEEE
jgi:DNA-directed RNA polymerase subunit beta